jgi:hypothetical protein
MSSKILAIMVKVVLIILLLPSLFAFEIDDEVDYDFTANLTAIFTTQPTTSTTTDIDLTTSISTTTPQQDEKLDDGKCFCDKRVFSSLLQRISKLENELRSEKLKGEEEIIFKINDDDFEWFASTTTEASTTSTKASLRTSSTKSSEGGEMDADATSVGQVRSAL